MSGKYTGSNGGTYQARFKDSNGKWGQWLNLGGGLKHSDVEVKLVEAAEEPTGPMWNALLNYVLEHRTEDHIVLLHLWREGSFDKIREQWPDVPEEAFPKTN